MKKSLRIVLLILLMAVLAMTQVHAADPLTYGDLQYIVSDNTAIIYGCADGVESLTIPAQIDGIPVTSISDYAFDGKTTLKSLTLPEGITHLGVYILRGTAVTEITVPASVKTIGYQSWGGYNGPFSGAENLKTITFAEGTTYIIEKICSSGHYASAVETVNLPSTVTRIGNHAFQTCKKLKNITIPETVTSIEERAFQWCESLDGTVVFPAALQQLGIYAYEGCTGIDGVRFGLNETEGFTRTINNGAFQGCTSLKDVELTETTATLGNDLFSGCTALETLTLPEGITHLGVYLLNGTAVTEITVPVSVNSIAWQSWGGYNGPFSGASNLKAITFAEGTTYIIEKICSSGHYASAVETVNLPSTVTRIGNHAFQTCKQLKNITIPETVTKIEERAFQWCESLDGTVVFPAALELLGIYAYEGCIGIDGVRFALNETEGFTRTINNGAFQGCTSLKDVELTATAATLGNNLFTGCTSLETLILPEGITHLGVYVICDTAVSEITVPASVKTISYESWGGYNGPFSGASNLKTITFAEGTTYIIEKICSSGHYESALETVHFPSTLTRIGNHTFQNCKKLKNVTIPETVTKIEERAFQWCESLDGTVVLPAALEQLGIYAYEGCTDLDGVRFTRNETEGFTRTINNGAFQGCTSLKDVELTATAATLGNNLFTGCTSLETLILPEGITHMGVYLISGTAITKITVPASLKTNSYENWGGYNGPFADCAALKTVIFAEGTTKVVDMTCANSRYESNLEKVYIPASVETIGEHAFDGCTKAVIYCEADSAAEQFARKKGIPYKDVIGLRDEVMIHATDFYYHTTEYRRGYGAFGTVMDFILETEPVDSVVMRVGYTDGSGTQNTELIAAYDEYLGAYVASMDIPEGMISIDSASAVLTEQGREVVLPLENSYWYSMPLLVEGTVTATCKENFAQYKGMVLKLYEENGRLAGSWEMGTEQSHVFHGLAPEKPLTAVITGDDLEFARVENIEVTAGKSTALDFTALPDVASITVKFIRQGKPLVHDALTARFAEATEGKSRVFANGMTLNYLADGDTILVGTVMGRELAVENYAVNELDAYTLHAGVNEITLELNALPVFTYSGQVLDGETGKSVLGAKITVLQTLNDQHPVSYTTTTDINGRFSLNVKDQEAQIIVNKARYAGISMDVEQGAYPEQLVLNPAGGKIKMTIGYLPAVAESEGFATATYSGSPDGLVVYDGGSGVTGNQTTYPLLYVRESLMNPGKTLRAHLIRKNYADLDVYATVDRFGNAEFVGTMKELGGIRLTYTRADHRDSAVQAVIFDQFGRRIRYERELRSGDVLEHLSKGSYTVVLADLAEPAGICYTIREMDSIGVKYVAITEVVEDGVIACPDSVEIPTKAFTPSAIAGDSRLSGNTSARVGETVWLTCEYQVADAIRETAKTLRVSIPQGVILPEGCVLYNNEPVIYTVTEQGIEIPVIEAGVLKLGVKILPEVTTTQLPFAVSLDYKKNGLSMTEVLGQLEVSVRNVTLLAPAQIRDGQVVVRGVAPKSSVVEIYDNDVLVGRAISNRYGAYQTEIQLDTEILYAVHSLVAVCGEERSEVARVQNGFSHPTVTEFRMYHDAHVTGGNEIAIFADREVGSFTGYMWPIKPFDFWVRFDRNDGVVGVAVRIDLTNGGSVRVPLTYSEESDYYEGTITLSSSQVPKAYGLEYAPVLFYNTHREDDYNIFEGAEKTLLTEEQTETGFYTEYRLNLADFEDKEILYYLSVEEAAAFTPTDDYMAVEGGYRKLTPTFIETEKGMYDTSEMYMTAENGTYVRILRGIGFAVETAPQVGLSADKAPELSQEEWEEFRESFNTENGIDDRGEMISQIDLFLKLCEEDPELKKETQSIREEFKAAALYDYADKSLDMINDVQDVMEGLQDIVNKNFKFPIKFAEIFADKKMSDYEKQADEAVTNVVKQMMDMIYEKFGQNEKLWEKFLKHYQKMADTKTIMDPSGYVYETVPENRISGVTTTVFFEDDYGRMQQWDAGEFYQQNPLITDENGKYAWDVPEGLWQVRYEKEGYRTVWSEKMPVPPPQLEVNIAMVSEEPAVVTSAEAANGQITVTFDKYLDVGTITPNAFLLTNRRQALSFHLSIPEPVVTADGMEVARSVVLTPNVALEDGTYTVQISETLATYAGVHLEEQTAVFTAKGFELAAALHAVTLEDGAVKVELTGEGRVLAAVYDQRGRMLACESRMAEQNLTIPLNTTGASYAVVYLLEEGTMKPLCDAKSSR